jgi:EAL domain-containing protein (putative c-di-GMP-specific phosphodiesterase class I)
MSHNLNLSVIAEGVETESQLNFLQHHLCDEVQGFFISVPLPHAQFSARLAENHFTLEAVQAAHIPA